jgi:hypothetical protein
MRPSAVTGIYIKIFIYLFLYLTTLPVDDYSVERIINDKLEKKHTWPSFRSHPQSPGATVKNHEIHQSS